jgi:hypothetical protein
MHSPLPVMAAEFLQLQLLGRGLLVLRRRVIPTLALGALEGDDLARCRHFAVSDRIEDEGLRIEDFAPRDVLNPQFSIPNPQSF